MPSCHIITTDGPAVFQHIPGDGHAHIVEFGPEPGDRLEFSVVSYGDETMQLTADASISSMAVQEEAVSAPTLQASAHTPISYPVRSGATLDLMRPRIQSRKDTTVKTG